MAIHGVIDDNASGNTYTLHVYRVEFPGMLLKETFSFKEEKSVEDVIEQAMGQNGLIKNEITLDVKVTHTVVTEQVKRISELSITYREDDLDEVQTTDEG